MDLEAMLKENDVPSADRTFPELPPTHPLFTIPIDVDHGESWLNSPFAADCCLIVGGRHYFLHAPLVVPHCDYLKSYLSNDMSRASRFMEELDVFPCPEAFSVLVEWMYTQKDHCLYQCSIFALYQAAKYLCMKDKLFDMLHNMLVTMWCETLDLDMLLQDALQAQMVPYSALKRFFDEIERRGAAIQGEIYLRLVFHWARDAKQVESSEIPMLQSLVKNELSRCTLVGLQRTREFCPEAFSLLVSSNTLLDMVLASEAPPHIFKFHCRKCNSEFKGPSDFAIPCRREVQARHSSNTFISRGGQECCSKCKQPLYVLGCERVFEAGEHCIETLDGKYCLRQQDSESETDTDDDGAS